MSTAQDQQSRAECRKAFEFELIDNHAYVPSDLVQIGGFYSDDDVQFAWDVWQAARALPAPENVREGEPYDNPAFEDLARTMGVWGTAQAALCAQFFLAGRGALPKSMAAQWFLHTLDTTERISGNKPHEVVTSEKNHPFGEPGINYSSSFKVATQALYTAEALPMGSAPACPLHCGWDGLHKIAVADGAYLTRIEWPEDEEGVSVQRAVAMRTATNLIDVCRVMLAAPRPPAAQEGKTVACACGDEFPLESYGAGFLDAKGKCFGCDSADEAARGIKEGGSNADE